MVTANFPGGSGRSTTSYVNSANRVTSYFTVPNGRAMANGSRNVYMTYFRIYVAGRSGTVTARAHFAGYDHGAFSAGAQGTPSQKSLPVGRQAAAGSTFKYGVAANGGMNFGRGSGGSGTYIGSNSGTTWGTSIAGQYLYAQAPAAPTNVGLDQITPTSIRYRFSGNDNGGAGITGWKIQYSKNSNFSGATTINGTGTTTVSGLTPNTRYYFRSAGVNIVTSNQGTYGPWSSSINAVTLASTPTAPRSPEAEEQSATVTKVTWTAPSSDGGSSVTGYDVQYANNSGFTGATTASLGNVLTWTSPSLSAGTWYFRIRAKNANGSGTWSAVVSNSITLRGFPSVFLDEGFVAKPAKVYLSGTWTVKPMKWWNGSSWITLT